jgi:1-acyl-sn-glycerol-3-phosphate acyltransferase
MMKQIVFWTVRSIVWILLHMIFRIYGGIRFEGRQNVPKRGGVLITPNHFSDADPPTIGLALPRACYFMTKEELFDIKFWGWLIKVLRGFPVKRYTADRAALRRCEELLKEGEAVVVFPEGKLSEDGKLQPFLPGALMAAQRAGVPIVPVALVATDKLMPYGLVKPRHAGQPIIVRFGKPITVAELTNNAKGSDALKLGAERLRLLVQALLDGNWDYTLPPIESETASEPAGDHEREREAVPS